VFAFDQWLAEHGCIVVALDNRGTPRRGRAWERAIKGQLGDVPLADQVAGLQALGRQHPELDLERVGVYGWSFGGYLSALAVLRRPDLFKVAVAGAPVVDWRDYDTHYTERYLDLPQSDPESKSADDSYARSSLLSHADKLSRPLLIIHGTADDNVYFFHSLKLVDALFRAGKRFDFLPLPRVTHQIADPLVREQLWGQVARYLMESLRAPRSLD
jgi:dipeptidyl-peptidase-4